MSELQIDMLTRATDELQEAVIGIDSLIGDGSIDALLPPVNATLLKMDLWCRKSFLETLVQMCKFRS